MSNVLFILTGSIACGKACDAISQLVQRGHHVRTVATAAALKFVGVATLEGLTREKVATDLFAPGEALDHINLSRWADLVIVCPATAHTVNRMAAGLADDLAGALLLAHEGKKPLLVAPAMNPAMWAHPATVASVDRLRRWGVRFVQPGAGRTACGEVGEGRLAEPDELVAAVEAALKPPSRRLRVLVTSGGTSEPIDGVRVLSNTSTGATGALIADELMRAGHDVLLVRAESASRASLAPAEETFVTFADLDAVLARRLGGEDFDAIIHAAAVSDFSVASIEVNGTAWVPGEGKIPSAGEPVLRLRRNPKLLDALRARSRNRGIRVVGFKLTRGADDAAARAAVASLFARGAVDFVVHNDLSLRPDAGAFPADIWQADGTVAVHCADRLALAVELERLLTRAAQTGAAASQVRS
ncbi:MAG TPA: bifunctional phosphopantothenoylcysteine decarboxylase/phosphopantothenate--cysteine ligase CoaBC [Opitutaceae bacterium]|nr:bifunctional phosphopantothenoylcysteine decarboxylase/phosphopantothenate--cysteine ligase CoaBC [Opitutaceae bacterium]